MTVWLWIKLGQWETLQSDKPRKVLLMAPSDKAHEFNTWKMFANTGWRGSQPACSVAECTVLAVGEDSVPHQVALMFCFITKSWPDNHLDIYSGQGSDAE